MKIEEILKIEDNKNIYLHNEGLFWRAYEYSAFAFVKHIKHYNVKKKYIKKVHSEIVFIGFPDSTLTNILGLCNKNGFVVNNSNSLITVKLPTKTEGFINWKIEIANEESDKSKKNDTSIIERIASFPLAAKTPMEAQQFLYQLQMEINGNI